MFQGFVNAAWRRPSASDCSNRSWSACAVSIARRARGQRSATMRSISIPFIKVPGYEADDIIATLVTQALADETSGLEVLILTGDRDSIQLVTDRSTVLYPMRGVSDLSRMTPAFVEDKYGVPPHRYPELAAIVGEQSDNLPGVPGVGEKTAGRLVADYGSLEGIYHHLTEHTPKLRQSLEENRDQVFLNRELSRLVDDLEVESDPEAFRLQPWDPQETRRVFDGLAFRPLNTNTAAAGYTFKEARVDYAAFPRDGFANVGYKTTGGAGGPVVTVTDAASLNNYVNQLGPYIVQVQGTINLGAANFPVGANKPLLGLGTDATLEEPASSEEEPE